MVCRQLSGVRGARESGALVGETREAPMPGPGRVRGLRASTRVGSRSLNSPGGAVPVDLNPTALDLVQAIDRRVVQCRGEGLRGSVDDQRPLQPGIG